MKISTYLDLTDEERIEIIKRYKGMKPDYGSGHYLSIRELSNGNILVSYHDDGNAFGGESRHHGEINFGKRSQLLNLHKTESK